MNHNVILKRTVALLKSIEWAGVKDNLGWQCCLVCEGHQEAEPCRISEYWSGVCERGTKCCTIRQHHPIKHQPGCELAAIIEAAEDLMVAKDDGGE